MQKPTETEMKEEGFLMDWSSLGGGWEREMETSHSRPSGTTLIYLPDQWADGPAPSETSCARLLGAAPATTPTPARCLSDSRGPHSHGEPGGVQR